MSTDLYGVRVLGIHPEERRVRLRVFVVYYDVRGEYHQSIPQDLSFFVRILWDKGDIRFGRGGPIGEEIDVQQLCDESFIDSNAHRFVERVEILETRNDPIDDYEGYHDFYYERGGCWQDEERLAQADYDLFVTDARYLEHLVLGMSWGTTSYETCADRPAPDDVSRVPDLRLEVHRLRPFSGVGEAATPCNISFSPDGELLVVTSEAGQGVVYALSDDPPVERHRLESGLEFPTVRVQGDAVALWSEEQRAWNTQTGAEVDVPSTHGAIRSPCGRWDVHFGYNAQRRGANTGAVIFVDDTGATLRVLQTGHDNCASLAFSGDLLICVGYDSTIEIRDVPSGELQRTLEVSGAAFHVDVSPDGAYLVITAQEKLRRGRSTLIVRLADGQVVRRRVDRSSLTQAKWSPDGRWMAVMQNAQSGDSGHVALFEVGAKWSAPQHKNVYPKKEPKPSKLDSALMWRIASGGSPVTPAAWAEKMERHAAWLAAGGGEGKWTFLEAAGLTLALFRGVEVEDGEQAVFRMARLSEISPAGCDLRAADFTACWGEDIDFRGANLAGGAATDAWLPRACFNKADLRGADFSRSHLVGADLRGADLRKADFERCDLSGADFTGAKIGGIKLKGAIVSGVVGFGTL